MLASTYFWVGIAFVIFVGIVVKMAGKSIIDGLDGRAERIRQELEEAASLREEAQAALAQYQRRQRDAVKEAEAIIAAAREEAARLRQHAAQDLANLLALRETQALEKIAQAETKALQQVRDLAVDLAISATERLLADNLDGTHSDRLVDAAIQELPAKLH